MIYIKYICICVFEVNVDPIIVKNATVFLFYF